MLPAGSSTRRSSLTTTRSQPIHRRQPAMGLAGAGVGGAGAVAAEHVAGLPAGQAHQVGFAAALGQPLVAEGVPELVRVEVRDGGLGGAPLKHLADAPTGELARS